MKIRIATAAPDIRPGASAENLVNLISLIQRAKAEEAAVLVLPAAAFCGMAEQTLERVREAAEGMPVYPLTEKGLSAAELQQAERMELLCCCADTPATAASQVECEELAALVSHDKKCTVALACPMGGGAAGLVYDGRCVIAQNGYVLARGAGYISAEVDTAKTRVKKLIESVVETEELPKNPWVPMPEYLKRASELQVAALTRRMLVLGQTRLTLRVDGSPSALLALAVCAQAMDRLHLSHGSIHVQTSGRLAAAAAAELGVTADGLTDGLAIGTDSLTRIALVGCGYKNEYFVNCDLPETVVRLALRSYAATCGNMRLGAVMREALEAPLGSEELDDFFLYYMQKLNLEPMALLKLAQVLFAGPYEPEEIEGRQKAFYRRFRAARLDWPRWPDGPLVFGLRLLADIR